MTSKKLLKILLLFILLPFTIFILSSGIYLFVTLKHNALDSIDQANRIYRIALENDARYALSTGVAVGFQNNIDNLVAASNGQLLSIELVNKSKMIVASAPITPDLSGPAIRVPVMIASSGNDLMDLPVGTALEEEAGYIEIRYNNNLPADAVDHFVWLFSLLFVALLSVIIITAISLRHKIFSPINRISRRIDEIIEGRITHVPTIEDDFLSSIDHGLNVLTRKQLAMGERNIILNQQLTVSRSNVDVANVTKILLINDLIERMDNPLINAREVMVSVISSNKDERIREGLKIIAAYLNDAHKTIRDSKILMEQVGRDTNNESITIEEFYIGIFEFIQNDQIVIIPGLLCVEKHRKDVIKLDTMHIYQLIGKVFSLATVTGQLKKEVYLTVRVEFRTDKSLTITIDIKDSSQGLSADIVRGFIQFMNNDNITFHMPNYPVNELQMIRYLSSRGGVQVSMSSEYGRGNNYRITIDREELPHATPTIAQPRLSGAILHNGVTNNQLREHFRTLGIDLRHILQYDAPGLLSDIIDLDFVIVEFVENFNETLELCTLLLSKNNELNIIPAYHEQSILHSNLKDLLFDMKIMGKHIAMPYGATTIIDALRGNKEPSDVLEKILESFTKKN